VAENIFIDLVQKSRFAPDRLDKLVERVLVLQQGFFLAFVAFCCKYVSTAVLIESRLDFASSTLTPSA
jgi:hypothetical protein